MKPVTYKKLTEETKEEIRRSFQTRFHPDIPVEHMVLILADHAIGLLELSEETREGWYQNEL